MVAMSSPYDQNPAGSDPDDPSGQNPSSQNPSGQPPYEAYPSGGQNPAGPNPYEQQAPYGHAYGNPYGAGAVPQPHPQGTTVLVLGILGLVLCFIAGIVAVVMGNKALKEIDANPGAYNNRQSVVIGRILGIIGIVLQVLGIIAYVGVVVLAVNSGVQPR
jgi:hypothetical protein